jgi:hypothetical protein
MQCTAAASSLPSSIVAKSSDRRRSSLESLRDSGKAAMRAQHAAASCPWPQASWRCRVTGGAQIAPRQMVPMTTIVPRVLAQLGQSCYERSARSSGTPLASSIVMMSSDRRRSDRAPAKDAEGGDQASSPARHRQSCSARAARGNFAPLASGIVAMKSNSQR